MGCCPRSHPLTGERDANGVFLPLYMWRACITCMMYMHVCSICSRAMLDVKIPQNPRCSSSSFGVFLLLREALPSRVLVTLHTLASLIVA